jgi:glycosyltransferase involved in cell wall biosynthesis
MELTILMPCLNEAETLEICIQKAMSFLERNNIEGEVLIADNGSTDGSQLIAGKNGARVVQVEAKGYGNALRGGIEEAKGLYIIMGDADDSYDFYNLEKYVEELRDGHDLVMGNRFKGGVEKGAMPFLHKYLGNPVLSFIGRLFFKSEIKDFHCGLRGFNTQKIKELSLRTTGMEFASEMVVKSVLFNYKVTEVPTTLKPDGRTRAPHLNTWRDGWRHLVFLLLYSPRWLFLIPSLLVMLISIVIFSVLSVNILMFNNIGVDIHTLTYLGFAIVLSYQLILFYIFSKVYAINQGLIPIRKSFLNIFKIFTLERGIVIGLFMFFTGFAYSCYLLNYWAGTEFGEIHNLSFTFRILIPSALLMLLGLQTVFGSFFLRLLGTIQHVKYIQR